MEEDSPASPAAIQNDTVHVLISNRTMGGYIEATNYLLFNKQYNVSELLSAGYTDNKLDSIYRGLIVLSGTDPLSLAINSAIPVFQKQDSAFIFGRNINLTISSVNGIHYGTKYLIDSTLMALPASAHLHLRFVRLV